MRAQLIVLYMSAAFWKLTTSWFDHHYSCSTVLMSELLAGLEGIVPQVKYLSDLMMFVAPELVAGIEFAVPALLLMQPRHGVLLALVFHQTINFMPSTYAGGFGIAMCARLILSVLPYVEFTSLLLYSTMLMLTVLTLQRWSR